MSSAPPRDGGEGAPHRAAIRSLSPALALVLASALVALAGWWLVGAGRGRPPIRAELAVSEALSGGDTSGFARATAPRPFVFPHDHGPHPEFRTEWWYYTGNLRAADGRHLGFQLTFFRTALAPPADAALSRGSAWAATQMYLAHLAVTDTRGGRFRAYSRMSREALGLAGAQAEPFRVWLDGWSVEGEGPTGLPMRLRATGPDVAINLALTSDKPAVLHGERGLSRKGPEPGNASFYYSLTRMPARGAVTIGGERLDVSGLAWMDREWSTSALGADLAGWDWFALQLGDGRELMFYQLRRKDGGVDARSAGTLVDAAGHAEPLAHDAVTVEVIDTWTSPSSGVRYPGRWRLTWRAGALALEVVPRLADQELRVGPRYWEGAVEIRGTDRGRPVTGEGYVELVGYGE
ncbi:MAG: carotenoid 1,2-hydratase [Candidatus Rokubacteria bacterium]|nr:carotenoid 1,2-hydratase [Candidatus Rokubacteria bacterium]